MRNSTTGFCHMWNGTKDGEDGYFDWASGKTNLNEMAKVNVTAENIRSLPVQPSLMKDGYELVTHHTTITADKFLDSKKGDNVGHRQEAIFPEGFLPEVTALFQKVTGCDDVIPYTIKIRHMNKDGEADTVGRKANDTPVSLAHTDLDMTTAKTTIVDKLGPENAARIMGYKKWAQVNMWRPINCDVQRWPLLFADRSKIPDWDYAKHTGFFTTMNDPRVGVDGTRVKKHDNILKNDDRYVFRYASNVSLEEALVFFSFHSDPSLVTPHGAFWDDSSAKDAAPRTSIEVRAFVGYN